MGTRTETVWGRNRVGRTLLSAAVAVVCLGSAVAVSGQGGWCILQDKIQVKGGGQVSAPHCVGPGIRSALDSGAAAPLRRGMPRRLPGRSTAPGCSGSYPGICGHSVGWEHVWRRRGNSRARPRSSGTPAGRRNARCGRQSSRPRQSRPAARPPIEMSRAAPSRNQQKPAIDWRRPERMGGQKVVEQQSADIRKNDNWVHSVATL